jgi:Na+-transporting NADH:ubiquinone oxidoreductase subunit NqrD
MDLRGLANQLGAMDIRPILVVLVILLGGFVILEMEALIMDEGQMRERRNQLLFWCAFIVIGVLIWFLTRSA